MKILVIDDDQEFLDLVYEASKLCNIECETAMTAGIGLKLIQIYNYKYIFCDFNIPGLDGLELINELSLEQRRQVFLVSGEISTTLEEDLGTKGIRVLRKPCPLETFTNLFSST